jgi:hypothetical protein
MWTERAVICEFNRKSQSLYHRGYLEATLNPTNSDPWIARSEKKVAFRDGTIIISTWLIQYFEKLIKLCAMARAKYSYFESKTSQHTCVDVGYMTHASVCCAENPVVANSQLLDEPIMKCVLC